LSPTTFSGGEKQRVNVARAFAVDYPIFLLDEPTSALDADNRQVILESIQEKKSRGSAIIGIFHDRDVRYQVCNREILFER
jgi:alpha-D-ribose 1-methylphosphonate 5-triphosphate synthase subunit PhnL